MKPRKVGKITESNNQITRCAEKEKISTATQTFAQACERSYSFPSCTRLVISNMLGFHFACKKKPFFLFVFFGAEAIPKDAKREKAPQCKQKIKSITKPELSGFAFIISSLDQT